MIAGRRLHGVVDTAVPPHRAETRLSNSFLVHLKRKRFQRNATARSTGQFDFHLLLHAPVAHVADATSAVHINVSSAVSSFVPDVE